ncbi:MAG: DUF1361 domain-containing protein [Chloracidobacterium sp.]|nr:DUF1361 domain-containing protein [Chloracidobacterium sp.]
MTASFKSSLTNYQSYRRQLAVLASLGFATALCLGLVAVRAWHYGFSDNSWLIWNLFLAWLPALGAFAAYNLNHWPTRFRWLPIIGLSLLWLLFLPNAPYLITDIIHLKQSDGAPWYDLITLVAFAWTGSFLGLVSLFMMQMLVRRTVGNMASWIFAIGALGLNGFGIYFGRFLGWNSWDVFFHPTSLLSVLLEGLRNPFAYLHGIEFAGLFTLLFGAVYLMLLSFTQLHLEHKQR